MKKLIPLFLVFLMAGCGRTIYQHTFSVGDHVQMQIDGREGMVTETFVYGDSVRVRFPVPMNTTMTEPYQQVWVHDFELELIERGE